MMDRNSAPYPARNLALAPGAFNLNDPQWGRHQDNENANGQAPEERDDQPPRPPSRPEGGHQGPPDLDELWRDFNRKLGGLFGGGGGGGNRSPRPPRRGGSGGGGHFQPNAKGAGIGLGVIAAIAVLVWLGSGFFIVQEGEQAVITQFGRYKSTVGAGFNWRLPYPIERDEIVRVTQIRSVDVGGDTVSKSTGLRGSAMLTSDENIVEIKFAVQYRLNSARDYLFETKDPDQAVVLVAESAVREVVGKLTMDEAMGEFRDQIAPRVRGVMQRVLDEYKTGVEVVAVNMQRGGVQPPEQVQEAFDDVLKATQERERVKNEAQAYANDVVPRAAGSAARLTQDAQGYKAKVVAEAQGDASRFLAILKEYRHAPKVTRDRMYIDTMSDIYGRINKILIDGRTGGNMTWLPLDKMLSDNAKKIPATTSKSSSSEGQSSAASKGSGSSMVLPPAGGSADSRARSDARSRVSDFR